MMQRIYRLLLQLYPADFRKEYGPEMTLAFTEAEHSAAEKNPALRLRFYLREIAGMLTGAFGEQVRCFGDMNFSSARFPMRSEFRFPKSAVFLMCLILAGVILAIEKATSVAVSLPASHPQLPPIHDLPPSFPQAVGVLFGGVYLAAILVWAILFAFKRSGVHRLCELEIQPGQK